MQNKIKVVFVIPTLFAGGAERVMSFVSQNLDKNKFDTSLIVIGFEKDSKYEISEIPVTFLNKDRVLDSVITLIKIFRKQKPDIVVSALTHLNIVMGFVSIIFPKIKFIGRHCIVSQTAKKMPKKKKSLIFRLFGKYMGSGYNYLDVILCQSKDMYKDMIDKFEIPEHKLKIINNPITDNFKLKNNNTPHTQEQINFITVARLKKLKGHERILKAISKLEFPYHYTMIGDGTEKEELFELIQKLGIKDNVTHIPYTTDVPEYLSKNDYYIMGSYAEGFPNCLIESCSVGTPAIAFRVPGGLNEIIENGVNGFLVDNETEFLYKLNQTNSLTWNSEKVRESVYKKFNKNKIINDYEEMFIEILK